MKKLMIVAATLAAGIAMADAIESDNTVGYIQQGTLPVGYSMVATQFIVPGTAASVNLLNYITGTFTAGTYKTRTTAAPMIKIYHEGAGYTTYYYLEDAEDDDENEVLGWSNGKGELVESINVTPGDAVWIYLPVSTATGVNFSGQVFGDATKSKACVAGYTMLSSPYPQALTFGDVTWSGLVPGEYKTRTTSAPLIKVYTEGAGYTTYYYLEDAEDDDENEVLGWANGKGELVSNSTQIAPMGKGFWVILPTGSATASVEFTSPVNN